NVWYRLTLTVTDSGGFSTTVLRDILPRKSTIRLATNPQWLLLTLDGQPVTAPAAVVGVVGMTRTLGALSPQTLNGVTYEFDSWSDGGAAIHDISTQSSDTTYTANFHVKPPTTGPAFQFDASSYQAGEDDGSITINVSRSGDASAAASVNYATSNGTASERGDYITALGTIDFAPGEISRSFSILLTDDLYVENSETVNLALSNPTGGVSLGNQSTALLIIHDNETAEPTTNPADQPEFFVRQHYLDFLNREPDPGGLAYWTSQIASCGNNAFCLLQRKIGVSAAFFVETEFQQTGFFIHRMYRAGLGQRPSYLEFMADRSRLNEGPNLNAEKEAYAAEFVRRSPFVNKYLQNTTPESFVDALLLTVKNTSGVDLSGKRGELLGEYNAGGDQSQSRARVLRKLIEYAEYIEVEYNRAFVLAQYFGYLRRDPDEGGYLFWLNVLNNKEPGNYRGMVCSFITSGEYQDRFSPVRTHSNRECQ
ncbi:MAG TPA: Calx-beta domain-containing protein, partial [Pyrinomonadaceae bacterium]